MLQAKLLQKAPRVPVRPGPAVLSCAGSPGLATEFELVMLGPEKRRAMLE